MLINLNQRLNIQNLDNEHYLGVAMNNGSCIYFNKTGPYLISEVNGETIMHHQEIAETVLEAYIQDNMVVYVTDKQKLVYEAYEQDIRLYTEEKLREKFLRTTVIEPKEIITIGESILSAGYKSAGPYTATYTPIDLVGVNLTFKTYAKSYSGSPYASVKFNGSLVQGNAIVKITEENKAHQLHFEVYAGRGNVSTDMAYIQIDTVDFYEENLIAASKTDYTSSNNIDRAYTATKDIYFSPIKTKTVIIPVDSSNSMFGYTNDIKLFIDGVDITNEELAVLKEKQVLMMKSTSGTVKAIAVALYAPDTMSFATVKENIIQENTWYKVYESLSPVQTVNFHARCDNTIVSMVYNNSNQVSILIRDYEGNVLYFARNSSLSRTTRLKYFATYNNKVYFPISSSLKIIDAVTGAYEAFTVANLTDSTTCEITEIVDGIMYAVNHSSKKRVRIDVSAKTSVSTDMDIVTSTDVFVGRHNHCLYYVRGTQFIKVDVDAETVTVLADGAAAPGTAFFKDFATGDIYIYASTYSKRILVATDTVEDIPVPENYKTATYRTRCVNNGIVTTLFYENTSTKVLRTTLHDVNNNTFTELEPEEYVSRIEWPIPTGNTLHASTEKYAYSSHFKISLPESNKGESLLSLTESICAADLHTLELLEAVYASDSHNITLNETIQVRDAQTLEMLNTVQAAGFDSLEAIQKVYAADNRLLNALVTVVASKDHTLEITERIMANDASEALLKESIIDGAANNLSMMMTVYGEDKADLNIKETVGEIIESYHTLHLAEKVLMASYEEFNLLERICTHETALLSMTEVIQKISEAQQHLSLRESIKENASSCVYIIEAVTTEGLMLFETILADASYKTRLIGFNKRVIQKQTNKE